MKRGPIWVQWKRITCGFSRCSVRTDRWENEKGCNVLLRLIHLDSRVQTFNARLQTLSPCLTDRPKDGKAHSRPFWYSDYILRNLDLFKLPVLVAVSQLHISGKMSCDNSWLEICQQLGKAAPTSNIATLGKFMSSVGNTGLKEGLPHPFLAPAQHRRDHFPHVCRQGGEGLATKRLLAKLLLLACDKSKVEILGNVPQPEQRGVRPTLLHLQK